MAITRALANNMKLILVGEPTAGLDTERGIRFMTLLKKTARENRSAVIVVTHEVRMRMIEGFDHMYNMKDGRLDPGKSASFQFFSNRERTAKFVADIVISHAAE
jgi:ABC-type lipoprotein export system ATPase subunit